MRKREKRTVPGWTLWVPEAWLTRIQGLARRHAQYRHGLIGGRQLHLAWYVTHWLPLDVHGPIPEAHPTGASVEWFGCWRLRPEDCPDPDRLAWIYLTLDENPAASWYGPLPEASRDSWKLVPRWVKMNIQSLRGIP